VRTAVETGKNAVAERLEKTGAEDGEASA
jgi:hypothetical protein